MGPVLNELYHISVVEVGNGHDLGFARKRGVAPIVDPQLPAVDGDGVDGRVAAMLPVRIDLDGAHR